MSPLAELFLARLANESAVLVQVQATEGSAPRDAGAWMGVFSDALVGTIGGGHLEFEAIDRARVLLTHEAQGESADKPAEQLRFVCC